MNQQLTNESIKNHHEAAAGTTVCTVPLEEVPLRHVVFLAETDSVATSSEGHTKRLHVWGDATQLYRKHKGGLVEHIGTLILQQYYESTHDRIKQTVFVDKDYPLEAGLNPRQLMKTLKVPQVKLGGNRTLWTAICEYLEYSEEKTVVTGFTYQPYSPLESAPNKIVQTPGGYNKVNTYRPSEVRQDNSSESRAATPILEHIEYLCDGDRKDAKHLLHWLAYNVQYPQKKIKHGVLLGSRHQGTGKSMLIDAMRKLLGHNNTNSISFKDITNGKQDWLADKVFVAVEEVKDVSPKTMNYLKRLITEDTVNIDKKYGEYREHQNHTNFMFTSNEERSLYIDEHDRRYFVVFAEGEPKEPEYYARLDQCFRNLGGFYRVLLEMDLSEFNPDAPPPMTDAKRKLIGNCRPDLELWIEQWVRKHPAFQWETLISAMRDSPYRNKASKARYIKTLLERLGFRSCRVSSQGSKTRRMLWFNPDVTGPEEADKVVPELDFEGSLASVYR